MARVAKWSISSRDSLMAQRVSGGWVAQWPILAMVTSGHGLALEQSNGQSYSNTVIGTLAVDG